MFSKSSTLWKLTLGFRRQYAAAIAANLAKGLDIQDAVRDAKEYVTGAIRHAFDLGKGPGPLNHFWREKLR